MKINCNCGCVAKYTGISFSESTHDIEIYSCPGCGKEIEYQFNCEWGYSCKEGNVEFDSNEDIQILFFGLFWEYDNERNEMSEEKLKIVKGYLDGEVTSDEMKSNYFYLSEFA